MLSLILFPVNAVFCVFGCILCIWLYFLLGYSLWFFSRVFFSSGEEAFDDHDSGLSFRLSGVAKSHQWYNSWRSTKIASYSFGPSRQRFNVDHIPNSSMQSTLHLSIHLSYLEESFYWKLHFHKFQSIANYWWKFYSDRTRRKPLLRRLKNIGMASEKLYRNALTRPLKILKIHDA